MIELPVVDRPGATASAVTADFLRLIADPTRRAIFLELMNGETCNCELAGLLGLPQNLISHHLRQLREAELIQVRRDARDQRWLYYSINPEALARIHQELGALFNPGRIAERIPQCGPAMQGSW